MDLLYSGKTKKLRHDAENGKTYLAFTDHATGRCFFIANFALFVI